ncbi:MAG: bifunctional (p)ppGpp synthetase/guanosine-3',5'-bis(diphosphate) 3'-pyrophosphohydrolase [Clostridia bacterium]|nr:bifunctional (p)ppGpp synthetase/guanosine-3',5'-bis(diphosphate) 3'-pyrophosphohydrolase [Clostridia bacterium]
MDNSVLDRAIVFATEAHSGTVRKDGAPYIVHPLEDASIVATMTHDPEVLAAAVLHDVLEDTDTTEEQIRAAFGDRVLSLVLAETENKRDGLPKGDTWKVRKEETLNYLKEGRMEEKMLWLGDKLSNLRSLKRTHDREGKDAFLHFNVHDPLMHKWYYDAVLSYLGVLAEYPAYKELSSIFHDIFDRYE